MAGAASANLAVLAGAHADIASSDALAVAQPNMAFALGGASNSESDMSEDNNSGDGNGKRGWEDLDT